MDSITQGLLGAVTAQLGFRQRIGRDATWVAAAAAVLPDLDSLVVRLLNVGGMEAGGLSTMLHHRGISHSLLMVPVIAAGAAGVWWWIRRRVAAAGNNARQRAAAGNSGDPPAGSDRAGPAQDGRRRAPSFALLWACCFVAVLSQPLLDVFTSYGTQLLSPITDTRFAIDAVPIIDMFYTPMLVLTLLTCYLIRKFVSRPRRTTLIVGWAGLLLSSSYIAAGAAVDFSLRKSAARALGTARTDAYPMLLTIFCWRVTAEDEEAWYVARHNVLFSGPLAAERFTRIPKVDNEWVRRARRLEEVKMYRWFARGRLRATYTRSDGQHVVEFHDMRYGLSADSPSSMWPLRVTFDADGSLLDVSRRRQFRRRDFRKLAGRVWDEVWSP